MTEVLNFFQELREGFPFLFEYVANSLAIAFISLGVVYMFGRMLNLLRSDVSKNVIALVVMIAVSWFLAYTKYGFSRPLDNEFFLFLWDIILYVSGSIIFYVLLFFKLYDRMDSLLDKKFGSNKPQRKMRKGEGKK